MSLYSLLQSHEWWAYAAIVGLVFLVRSGLELRLYKRNFAWQKPDASLYEFLSCVRFPLLGLAFGSALWAATAVNVARESDCSGYCASDFTVWMDVVGIVMAFATLISVHAFAASYLLKPQKVQG